jgi:hypothetical protein
MTSSAISEAQIGSIAAAIFAAPSPRVLESYSEPDRMIRCFSSSEDVLSYVADIRESGSDLVHLAIWYPDMLGQMEVTRLALNPAKCNGHTFRYRADGWGLISVQLRLAGSAATPSRISANSQSRAEKWASVCPELGPPSRWAWSEVSRHTRRLSRALHKAG